MLTAIGAVLMAAAGAKSIMPPPHHSMKAIAASRLTAGPATTSSYFRVTPRMNGTIIADTTRQTAITR
jgi:hypothetical protein